MNFHCPQFAKQMTMDHRFVKKKINLKPVPADLIKRVIVFMTIHLERNRMLFQNQQSLTENLFHAGFKWSGFMKLNFIYDIFDRVSLY